MFQRNPKTQYGAGGNYPVQNNTGQASAPESDGLNPSSQRLSLEDYMAMMQQSFGELPAKIAVEHKKIALATDRSASITVTSFGTDYNIPEGEWRTVIIARPSFAESLQNISGLVPDDFTIAFDHSVAMQVVEKGYTIIPFLNFKTFQLENVNVNRTAGTYPAGWAVTVMFSTREYDALPWTPQNPLTQYISVTQPAAGQDWTYTVPVGNAWRLKSAVGYLITDATAGSRSVSLQIVGPLPNQVIGVRAGAPAAESNNSGWYYNWFPGAGFFQSGAFVQVPIPDIIMPAGTIIRTATLTLDAGDQWSLVRLIVESVD